MKSSCGCQTCDKRELRTEFVHRSIDRLGTGKEFNRIGTLIRCASNLFYFKTSHLVHFAYLALWIIPTCLTLKVLGFSPGNINFLFVFFCLFFFFNFNLNYFSMDLLNLFRVNAHVQMCNDFCYVQIENNVEMKRSDPVKKI